MSATEQYRKGYADAKTDIARDLASVLRIRAIEAGISDATVREIFAGVFGVKATDDEFGDEPTGAGVRAKLKLRAVRA